MLVSTRIGGLIKESSEVKLALMVCGVYKRSASISFLSHLLIEIQTIEEAVDMLAHGAGLDSASSPPSLLEVARLCGSRYIMHISPRPNYVIVLLVGRLPLCLNIASMVIAESGDNWEQEVNTLLKA
jgi:hypothetical protein